MSSTLTTSHSRYISGELFVDVNLLFDKLSNYSWAGRV